MRVYLIKETNENFTQLTLMVRVAVEHKDLLIRVTPSLVSYSRACSSGVAQAVKYLLFPLQRLSSAPGAAFPN